MLIRKKEKNNVRINVNQTLEKKKRIIVCGSIIQETSGVM